MGITAPSAQFLASCRREGVDFARTLTLGRQQMLLTSFEAERLGVTCEVGPDAFAEPFFASLGASCVDAMDASAYEGASIVHDLNQDLPPEHAAAFTAVVDGGTLEHVFDVRRAMGTVLSAVAEGGHFIAMSPTNNECGHGFYQFSPEFWFRVLSPDNGFEVERLFVCEVVPGGHWYRVTDPAQVGGRVQFRNGRPTYAFVQARRTAVRPLFDEPVLQSDYVKAWGDSDRPAAAVAPKPMPLDARLAKSLRLRRARAASKLRSVIGRPVDESSARQYISDSPRLLERVTAP